MYIDCESLLTEFSSKTDKRNITKKINPVPLFYISLLTSFIAVIIVTLSWSKTDSSQSACPAGDQLTTAFTILKCMKTSSSKSFWSFWSFQISWTYRDVFQINEKFIHNFPPCLPTEVAKVASSVARARLFESRLTLTQG